MPQLHNLHLPFKSYWLLFFVFVLFQTQTKAQDEKPAEVLSGDFLIPFRTEKGAGFMDTDGNTVIEPIFWFTEMFKDGLVKVTIKENEIRLQGVYNNLGEEVLTPAQQSVDILNRGYFVVSNQFSKTLMHEKKGEILSCEDCMFEYVASLNRVNLHRTRSFGRHHPIEVYTMGGNLVFKAEGLSIKHMANYIDGQHYYLPYYQLEIVRNPRTQQMRHLDGRMIYDTTFLPIGFERSVAVVQKDGLAALVDLNFNELIPFSKNFQYIYRIGPYDYLFGAQKDDKYGMVDEHGQEVLPITYTYPLQMRDNLLSYYDKKLRKHIYLNWKGQLLVPDSWEIESVAQENIEDVRCFSVSNEKGKYGYMDDSGNVLIPCEYDFLSPITEDIIVYFKGDSSGYMNINGKIIAELNQPRIAGPVDGIGAVGHRVYNGSRSEFPCAQISSSTSESYVTQYNYIDNNGKLLNSFKFDWIFPFYNGIGQAQKNCVNFWLDEDIQPASLSGKYQMSYFNTGVAVIMDENKKYGLIDSTGKIIAKCMYDEIMLNEGKSLKYNIYDKYGKNNGMMTKAYLPDIKEGTLRVRQGEHWGLIDMDGNKILNIKYHSINITESKKLYRVYLKQGDSGKTGLYSFNGTEVLPIEYDTVGKYSLHGLYACWKDGICGQVSEEGEIYWPKISNE